MEGDKSTKEIRERNADDEGLRCERYNFPLDFNGLFTWCNIVEATDSKYLEFSDSKPRTRRRKREKLFIMKTQIIQK
jgi:hypothetical protein